MTHKYHHKFSANIFKIHIDPEHQNMALEIKDGAAYQSHWVCLNLALGEMQAPHFDLPEDWWIGLSAFRDHIFLFHLYPEAQKPESKGLSAWSAQSGQELWTDLEAQLCVWNEQGLLIRKRTPEGDYDYFRVEPQTGNLLETLEEEHAKKMSKISEESLAYPQHYPEENEHFSSFKKFFFSHLQLKIVKGVDYLEQKNHLILSYFLSESAGISNNLLILDSNARILYKDQIDTKLQGISLDNFFMYKNYLIYIKNKSELNVISL